MAMSMLYLIVFTLVLSFSCYVVGFVLRKFVPRYRDFQYRLSLPVVACCTGSIGSLLIIMQLMSLFLVDALYKLSLVQQYPELCIGTIDVAIYTLGGYYSTKYAMLFAHKLDLNRIEKKNERGLDRVSIASLQAAVRNMFQKEE